MKIPKLRKRTDRNLTFAEHQGKRFYFGPPGPESTLAYQQWVVATFGGDTENPCIADLTFDYLQFMRSHYGNHQEREHICKAVEFLEPHHFELAEEFGPRKLASVRDAMRERPTWSDTYVNRQIRRIRRMFRWGVEREYVTGAVLLALDSLSPLKAAPKEKQRVELATVHATLKHLTPVVRSMVMVQLLTACRPGEVCGMTPAQLDRTEFPWVWTVPSHKDQWRGKTKVLYLGPRAQHCLLPLLRRADTEPVFSPREAESMRGYRNRRASTQYTAGAYRQVIRRVCEAAGIDRWTPYQLRALAAELTSASHGSEGTQAILDHERLDTQTHYLNRRRALARRIAEERG